jgi:thiol-disulfide isomerase/thioredoxin
LRTPRFFIVAAVIALLATACGDGGSLRGHLNDQSSFTAPRLGGGDFVSTSIEGANTVLWFWAPWCTSCRAESKNVIDAAAEFDGSVQVIGVAGRGDVSDMNRFVEDTGTGGLEHIVDSDGRIWSRYGVIGQPAFAFISATGEIDVVIGALGRAALIERMQKLSAV